jgi:N-acetylglucosaminyldiphosphoundecaprenol N-acetyl-beta-D-mannosaminyltransferase
MMREMNDSSVNILGVTVSGKRKAQVLSFLLKEGILRRSPGMMVVFTPTTEQVVMAQADVLFRSTLNSSTINVPDTTGLVWADWWQSKRHRRSQVLKERVTGIDLAHALALETLKQAKKVFLLGGGAGVGEKAALKLQEACYQLPVTSYQLSVSGKELVGWDSGADDISRETEVERERVLTKIAQFEPALLLVAFGAPWQERWIIDNRERLEQAGVRVAMVVGGAFDVWAGKLPRAPLPIRKIGLEWLWRLMLEPKRWRRQMRLVEFVRMILFRS